jgi:cytochrome c oxidase cbb3-type subunit 1
VTQLVLHLSFIITWRCCIWSTIWLFPSGFLGSQSISWFAGVQGALVQWWYGHNAVGFFLTAGFLMMYYFVPKQPNVRLFLSPLDHPLLGADLHLYLGRSSPPALHRAADWTADAGHGVLCDVDAVLGQDDQRPDDAERAHGTSCVPIRSCACS